jgi:hypothetical protein
VTHRLYDCDIHVRRHPHPSAGGALTGALLTILDDAGLTSLLDEDGCIAGFAPADFAECPVTAFTALADTGLVRPGSWVDFVTGDFAYRVRFVDAHVLALDSCRAAPSNIQETV